MLKYDIGKDKVRLINIAFYTGGKNVPSARFRARQYKDELYRLGIQMKEQVSCVGKYPPVKKTSRPFWLLQNLFERALQIRESYTFDVLIFQRELISTLLTLEPFFARPRLLDVDDAIWVHRRGSFAGKLAKQCDAVLCGNRYLAEYFSTYNDNIYIIPTAINTQYFKPRYNMNVNNPEQVIGWSGTSANLHELERLEEVLSKIMRYHKNVRLRVICDRQPTFNTLPFDRVDFVTWSQETEVIALQDLTVGIMPLGDNAWTRGKCSFKMLTYMACGIPVVVSPVGMNADVLAEGHIGYGAVNDDEWFEAISAILSDRQEAYKMGKVGRSIVDSRYSVNIVVEKLAAVIKQFS